MTTTSPAMTRVPDDGDDGRHRLRRSRFRRSRRSAVPTSRRADSGPGVPSGARHDLIVPLATLLGLAERPGEIHGFGLLDPALARELAAAAAASPRTEVCVTVTSPEGYAIGHGCARPDRTPRPVRPGIASPGRASRPAEPDDPRRHAPRPLWHSLASHTGPWSFTVARPPRAADQRNRRTASAPGRSSCRAGASSPCASTRCRSSNATTGTRRTATSRATGSATLSRSETAPVRSRPATGMPASPISSMRVPYDQGGKTCTCNAGARSRACHQVKQSPRLERHPAKAGLAPVGDPGRPRLHAGTEAVPRLILAGWMKASWRRWSSWPVKALNAPSR